jgi:uncharacterized membrane protein YgcG
MPHHHPLSSGLRRSLLVVATLAVLALALAPALLAAGPPYPAPLNGQRVYDTAEALSATEIARAEAQIKAIEQRTGAQVVVYTQLVEPGRTSTQADADAQALMDQWGVGRKGIDDGLVILFDLYRGNACHGQVQLYAGPGFRATYLTNEERQAIYENDMLPLLRGCALDAALGAAMSAVDAAATPEHAATLQAARQVNAVLGLIVAPAIVLLAIGGGLLRWRIAGKDPVYLDDPSILMPAPPPGLTPAAGAAVRDGQVSRRAMTAASLDLAVRGLIAFKSEPPEAFARKPGLGIYTGAATTGDAVEQARLARARSRVMDPATAYLQKRLDAISGAAAYIRPDKITELGKNVAQFNKRLEAHLVQQGWYGEAPSGVTGRWTGYAVLLCIAGVIALVIGFNIPSSGAVLLGGSAIVGGVGVGAIGTAMPRRTMQGAVIKAMLEAYRRTLEKTMAMSRSMGDVVSAAAIPLIESPDDAVAWGVALGLQDEVENILARSAAEEAANATGGYIPAWWLMSTSHGWGSGGGGAGGMAPGLMSSSPIPDFGGMMAALGTIGSSPASSGSGGGGGGGFGGGGSGGGGGGAGGGF